MEKDWLYEGSYTFLEASFTFKKILRVDILPGNKNTTKVLDEHDSPQWYDIVHFEHKLLWLCFGFPQKASHQWS